MHTHFDIFIEDSSGSNIINSILEKILPNYNYTYRIHSYRGCGKLPSEGTSALSIRRQTLLDNVPRLIRGFQRTYASMANYRAVFILITDCDSRDCPEFKNQIVQSINSASLIPMDNLIVCIAIEELEAWLLGDYEAIKAVYPDANDREYETYEQDSICGTWEKLARIIDIRLYNKLIKSHYYIIGQAKNEWARNISPYIDIRRNKSPSLQYFVRKVYEYL